MYTQIWNKYLPIIRILLKRSLTADQVLNLNTTDFERAGAARKSGYKFAIHFVNSRVDNIISASPLAKDLAAVLLDDSVVRELFSRNDYDITMNAKFHLAIKCHVKAEAIAETDTDNPVTEDVAPGEDEG
jgi:hypothetical protein